MALVRLLGLAKVKNHLVLAERDFVEHSQLEPF